MKLATLTSTGAMLVLLSAGSAHAESFQTCTGYINTIPATISKQGTWCLAKDVSTANAAGTAIDIAVNNVIIDCNGFKIGNLAAGLGTQTTGIAARNRLNATVRNCNVRGFLAGIDFSGEPSAGHVVENNRFDNNTAVAVRVEGSGSTIRGNVITDTGEGTVTNLTSAIYVGDNVDVIDNLIDGVQPSTGVGETAPATVGVIVAGSGAVLRGNRIRNLIAPAGGAGYGVYGAGAGLNRAADNDLFGLGGTSWGVWCSSQDNVSLSDNYIGGFGTGYKSACSNDGNNTVR